MKKDTEIVLRLQNKDDEAWSHVVTLYYDRLLLFCGRYVQSQHEAEDLVHDTFFRAMVNISKFDVDRYTDIQPWLWQIAKTTSLMHIRYKNVRKGAWPSAPKTVSSSTMTILKIMDERAGPRTEANEKEKHELVFSSLDKIDEKFREVIYLCYIDGLTRKQVAELLDISENTVKSRLRIALEKVRSALPTAVIG